MPPAATVPKPGTSRTVVVPFPAARRPDPDRDAIQTLGDQMDAFVLATVPADTAPHQVTLALLWALQKSVQRGFNREDWLHVSDLVHRGLSDHLDFAKSGRIRHP